MDIVLCIFAKQNDGMVCLSRCQVKWPHEQDFIKAPLSVDSLHVGCNMEAD